MRISKFAAAMLGAVAGTALLLPAGAGADVTIGSNLAGEANQNICVASISCTYFQTSAGTSVAKSPIDGRVVRWRLKAGSSTGVAKLRVLRPAGTSFTAVASSKSETVSIGTNTFTTNLSIKTGDVVALDNSSSGLYFTDSPAVTVANVLYFQPSLADGAAGAPNNQRTNLELLMNADVAPNPSSPTPTPTPTPKISALKLSPPTFRAAKSGASVAKKRRRPPIGATVGYTLTTDATVSFSVERAKPGRRRAGKCGKPGRRPRGKGCTRFVAIRGSFAVAGRSGTNQFKFTGRISNRKLAKGRYRLVGKPSAQGKIGTAIRASFRIE
jgi:hypothetical protein